jgi:hypothetical protein
MAPFERRALTLGEIALGRSVFGDEIAWRDVRVMQLPAWGFWAMVPMGRTVLYAKLKAWRDFSAAPVSEQGIFIHELTHVWQAGQGVLLAFAKLRALGRGAYLYRARPDARLKDYNIEAQAEIARHLHESRLRAADKNAPPLAWLEEIWTRR